ncbi:hypothetical protein [Haliangium ochraceum]|uniref:Uncharacterized protein n=1 Tax=Haliangium ochraceum (strain DSM 14365 / JCM 11303 / SMP-2) TaxID=502025 RepID=D0LU70_HALO1|nr:hypothetical protein [Haliangium ochraceum]ACY17434.1 hypothetical protein Hoch_4945 [Haliangium ochraceum DSM 14365]
MGGCTNCGAKAGCDHRKGDMFAAVDQTLEQLYPTHTWGQPDDLARFGAGIDEEDGQALADELARELDASTFFRPGDADEYCDYIYVLCLGREPCLVQIRDGEVPVPGEIAGDPEAAIHEQYLRVCLSHMARMAGVQQTAMSLLRADGGYLLREEPRPGVYDAPLLRRFQRLVSILPAYDIVHLDFGEISAPPRDFDPGDYAARYGGKPHTANYLFYPQPSNMKTTCFVPEDGAGFSARRS